MGRLIRDGKMLEARLLELQEQLVHVPEHESHADGLACPHCSHSDHRAFECTACSCTHGLT